MKQNQAHGKPNRANPLTDSQKKKKNRHKIRNQTYPLYPRSRRCRDYRENQSLIYWDSLQITIYRAKSKHTQSNILCLSKKKKKNPNTDSVPKQQNQTKTPNVVVTVAKLAHCRRRLVVARPSSQSRPSSQIDLLKSGPPVLSSLPRPSQSPSESPVLSSSLKAFLSSLSFSLSVSLSLSHWSLKVWKKNNECPYVPLSLWSLFN